MSRNLRSNLSKKKKEKTPKKRLKKSLSTTKRRKKPLKVGKVVLSFSEQKTGVRKLRKLKKLKKKSGNDQSKPIYSSSFSGREISRKKKEKIVQKKKGIVKISGEKSSFSIYETSSRKIEFKNTVKVKRKENIVSDEKKQEIIEQVPLVKDQCVSSPVVQTHVKAGRIVRGPTYHDNDFEIEVESVFEGSEGSIIDFIFFPPVTLISCSSDDIIRIWNTELNENTKIIKLSDHLLKKDGNPPTTKILIRHFVRWSSEEFMVCESRNIITFSSLPNYRKIKQFVSYSSDGDTTYGTMNSKSKQLLLLRIEKVSDDQFVSLDNNGLLYLNSYTTGLKLRFFHREHEMNVWQFSKLKKSRKFENCVYLNCYANYFNHKKCYTKLINYKTGGVFRRLWNGNRSNSNFEILTLENTELEAVVVDRWGDFNVFWDVENKNETYRWSGYSKDTLEGEDADSNMSRNYDKLGPMSAFTTFRSDLIIFGTGKGGFGIQRLIRRKRTRKTTGSFGRLRSTLMLDSLFQIFPHSDRITKVQVLFRRNNSLFIETSSDNGTMKLMKVRFPDVCGIGDEEKMKSWSMRMEDRRERIDFLISEYIVGCDGVEKVYIGGPSLNESVDDRIWVTKVFLLL